MACLLNRKAHPIAGDVPQWWGACLGMGEALDLILSIIKKKKKRKRKKCLSFAARNFSLSISFLSLIVGILPVV